MQIIGVSALTEPDGDLSHTLRMSVPARRDALANNYNPTRRLILADLKITDSHMTFEGRRWFRGGASEAALGCDGRKRAPVFGVNFIEVQGRIPLPKMKIRKCVTIESDYAGTSEADLLANIDVAGVFKGSSKTALKDLRESRIKLVQFTIDNEDLRAAANAAPNIIQRLIDYGNDARLVDTVFTVLKASTAEVFGASEAVSLSVDAGVVKVSVDGSVGGAGGVFTSLSPEETFAYGLVKLDWDANEKKNKRKIVMLTDDQWGP